MTDHRFDPAGLLRSLIPQQNALLILGVQRTGTTLLAQDIASLAVIGSPGEHFLEAELQTGGFQQQARTFAKLGAIAGGDTFAVTLMSNYLERFGRWLANGDMTDREVLTQNGAQDLALRFFTERFRRTTIVTVLRQPIWHAAYSHWRVSVTNQYHKYPGEVRTGQRRTTWTPDDPLIPDPVAILEFTEKILQDYLRLSEVLERNDLASVELTYDEVVNQFPDYLTKVLDAAGHSDVPTRRAQRHQLKLTPLSELKAAKAALERYLGEEID